MPVDFSKFDIAMTLLWIVPGAFIALFRSFAIRGSFPSISKDDVSAFLLGSIVYAFIVVLATGGKALDADALKAYSGWTAFFVIVVLPALVGMVLGLIEASDTIGRLLRKVGIRLPSPDATAWETLFRELPSNSVLVVTLKDGSTVAGRWVGGSCGSASSSDSKIMDLYLGQTGTLNAQGTYTPKTPRRGIYLSAGEIRYVEVIPVQ